MQNIELIIQADKEILLKRRIISSAYCRSPKYYIDDDQMKQISMFLKPFREIL